MTEKNIENIDELIGKVISGNANKREEELLGQWIKESENNLKYFNDAKRVWNADQDVFAKINIVKDKESVKDKIIARLSINKKTSPLQMFYKIAAIFTLPLLISTLWLMSENTGNKKEYAEIKFSFNKDNISVCTLTDGTKVWLNKGSEIKVASDFENKTREILLTGEAYFKVAKNPQKPFIVHTGNLDVKVLGTSFNVKSLPGSNKVETTLEEGSVRLEIKESSVMKSYALMPGHQAIFNKANNEVSITAVDTRLFSSWRNNKYIFKDETLESIAKKLEDIYGVKISFSNDNLRHLHFRGMIETNKTILNALESFHKTTNINYEIKNNEVMLFPNKEKH